jgi:hypothetical protein
VRTLAAGPRNGAWAPDGTVLLGSGLGPLLRVPANGGAPVPATVLQGQQTQHWFPSMLPDGRRFLFYGGFGADVLTSGVFIGSLDAGKITRAVSQVQPGSSGWFVPPHWLLYVQQGSLLASRFDAERGTISGTPVRVAADIGDMTGGGVSVSPSGTIAYRPNVDFSRSQLTWFDRTGRALGTVGPAEVQGEPRVSPDATGVLTTRPQAIFLFDGRRLDRITVGRSGWPSWMPDGRRVVYSNGTSGRMDLWVKSIDETGDGVPFASSNQNKVLTSWTPDGGTALVDSLDPQDGMDLLVIDAAGDRRLRPWLKTRSVERGAQFSPDGRFVAYQSNQSGRFEVYVRPFAGVAPAPSRQSTISTGGGISPRWSPDGGEIYFIAPDGSMMAVPVKGQGNTLTVGPAERLFKVAIKGGGTAANIASNYDVARDGRFLVNVVNDDPTPIVIIQNWRPPEPSAPTP